MTSAALSTRPSASSASDSAAILVLGATRTGEELVVRGGTDSDAVVAALNAVGFRAGKDELVRLPATPGITAAGLAVVGIPTTEPSAADLRYAAGTAARRVTGRAPLLLDLGVTDAAELEAVLEGAGLGSYDFTDYRGAGTAAAASADGEDAADAPDVTSASAAREIVAVAGDGVDEAGATSALARTRASVDAVNRVRDLVNVPALDRYDEVYAHQVVELAEGLPLDVTVWDFDELVAGGFGGIVGVGQGSDRLPRLVKVDYAPSGASAHLALVGKGITFDTGGLSLKPPVSMIGMKYDMAGSATVLATVVAAAELGLPVRVTAWLCLAENMPSGKAIRPGDVLTIRGGRTVEVLNTDAEGRLVLADGLVIAGEDQPDAIVDVATLTGAAVVALGNRYVAAMGDGDLVRKVLDAASEAGEPVWHMPLPADMRPLLNSDIADIANVKPGNTAGGMLVAGLFLKDFVPLAADGTPIPWVHLDIAGPAQNKDAGYGFTVKGPTGVTVRTLLRLAEAYSRA